MSRPSSLQTRLHLFGSARPQIDDVPYAHWLHEIRDAISVVDSQRPVRLGVVTLARPENEQEHVMKRLATYLSSLNATLFPVEDSRSIYDADAFLVIGGSTQLLFDSIKNHPKRNLLRQSIIDGKPYLGFHAGASLASNNIIIGSERKGGLDLLPWGIYTRYADQEPRPTEDRITDEIRTAEKEMNAKNAPTALVDRSMACIGLTPGAYLKTRAREYEVVSGSAWPLSHNAPYALRNGLVRKITPIKF